MNQFVCHSLSVSTIECRIDKRSVLKSSTSFFLSKVLDKCVHLIPVTSYLLISLEAPEQPLNPPGGAFDPTLVIVGGGVGAAAIVVVVVLSKSRRGTSPDYYTGTGPGIFKH
jgi:hypothetical protein